MGLFNLFKNQKELEDINVSDDKVVAIADATIVLPKDINDPAFSEELMGKTIGFKLKEDKVILCSPANGTLSMLFPTCHAYGITCNDGKEILIHCGIDTVNSKGYGFKLLKKKQGDKVKAGDPIVEVDVKKLEQEYDMTTVLIITNVQRGINFKNLKEVKRGDELI